MIVDIKTALDRYLTHSLTRTLDRQSQNFFLAASSATRDEQMTRHVKKARGARTRDGRTHRPDVITTDTGPHENRHATPKYKKSQ